MNRPNLIEMAAEQPKPADSEIMDRLNERYGTSFTENSISGKITRLRNAQATRARGVVDLGERMESVHSPTVDPTLWEQRSISVVETESGDGQTMRRTSATYAPRRKPVIEQVEDGGPLTYWSASNVGVARAQGESIICLAGDPQWPYEDTDAWRLHLAWLADVRPDRLVMMGDETDFPTVSRHPRRPWNELTGGLGAEMAYAYARLREVREAVGPDCQIDWIEGNHDERLYGYLVGNALQLATLCRAGETDPVMSPRHLLRLDELGINYVGHYPASRVVICPDLVAIHGETARKGSGNSARSMGTRLPNVSIAQGHTHRLAIACEAVQSLDGTSRTRYLIETGSLCKSDGLGYMSFPDWQQGWVVISMAADGSWSPEIVPVRDRAVAWRGQRWSIEALEAEKAA